MQASLAVMLLALLMGAFVTLRGEAQTLGACIARTPLASVGCPSQQSPQAIAFPASGSAATAARSEA
jgi:hypothetical protein